MNNQSPIGLFDSGVGGTSIWHEVHRLLPHENTVYFADSYNAPYGDKTQAEIIALSKQKVEFLLEKKAKIIVVACNTATTNAMKVLRHDYDVPFIGLEPAIKPAAALTKTGHIGVLATKRTIISEQYQQAALAYQNVTVHSQIGYDLVGLIESGNINTQEMDALLQQYLSPMLAQNIDQLVLGCTHYPYLKANLQRLLPADIAIIDSGVAVARQTKHILEAHGLLNASGKLGQNEFYTNGDLAVLQSFVPDETHVYQQEL